jgi:hypothetical protein
VAGHRNRCICVYDYGLFVELAVTLAKDFGRVLYYCPWQDGYPKSNALLIGSGLEGIERISTIWPYLDEIDLFVFPDVYEGHLQEHLISLGKRVWGSRLGEELELDRVKSKELARKIGIDIGPYAVVDGLDDLRKYLKKNDDQWVKISATRGDMETFHSKTYSLAEPRLDHLEHSLGAKKKTMKFIVEQAINNACEVGYDGYTVDGRYAKQAIVGVEVKCKSYVGRALRYNDLPDGVKSVNDKLSPVLKGYQYRGFISTEIRCNGDGNFLIDPCARCGSPPSEFYQVMIANLADIIWHGSEGILIEPEYISTWGAELIITSEWAMTNWLSLSFPKKYRDNIKIRNAAVIDGKYYYVPDRAAGSEIGAVIAIGSTHQEAIDECRKIAETIESHDHDVAASSLDEAREDLAKFLGDKFEDKPLTKEQKQAEAMRAKGKISEKQFEKIMAKSE